MTVEQMMALEAAEFAAAIRKINPALADWAGQRLAEGFTVQAVKDALVVLNNVARASKNAA